MAMNLIMFFSNSSSENLKSVWDQYKSKTNGHGFNNVPSNNLSRTITVHLMNQNK